MSIDVAHYRAKLQFVAYIHSVSFTVPLSGFLGGLRTKIFESIQGLASLLENVMARYLIDVLKHDWPKYVVHNLRDSKA